MPGLPMMPWFPDSFLGSTLGWPWKQRAIYRALLDAQWLLGSLPTDHAELAAIVGCSVEELEAAWPRVGLKFSLKPSLDSAGSLANERLEEHRRVAFERHRSAVEKGRKGGKTRADRAQLKPSLKPSLTPGSTPAQASKLSPSPSPSPSETSQSLVSVGGGGSAKAPPASRGTRLPADFELTEKRRKYAADQGLDPERVFKMFTTYWWAKAGPNGVKLNWDSTWQHWCLKDAEKNVHRDAPRKTRFDQLMEG